MHQPILPILAATALAASAALASVAQSADLRLYVMDCGSITFDDPAPFSLSKDEVATLELSVPCFLIAHPAGTLLWDAGLPPDIADHPEGIRRGGAFLQMRRTLASQLEEIGHPPDSIRYVAFSHLHYDHTGSGNLFARSTWLIQRPERAVAFTSTLDAPPYFDPTLYAELEHAETRILDGDHDVFGDGRVRIVSAPGHTPGHQVLLVNLAETGPVVLSGDLYHFAESRTLRRVPAFNVDREASLASIDKVEALVAELGAQLWIQHDSIGNAKLKKSPESYR